MVQKNSGAKLCAGAVISFAFLASLSTTAESKNDRAMSFPSDQSYGTLINLGPNWNLIEKHPKGTFFAEARGKVPYSTDDALMLTANFPLTANPAVMNNLPIDAIQFINIASLPAEDKIFGPLSRLTGLRRLDFDEGEFGDKAFSQLSKIVNLEAISVKECFVTGESLTHFGTLKKLQYMSLKRVALDWKLLNKSTTVFPAMSTLHFTDTNLTDEGLKWLEKMPNLKRLTLDSNAKLTDKGLLALKKLKHLQKLDLKQLKLTANGIIQLKGSSIRNMFIEDIISSPADVRRIEAALPNVQIEVKRKKTKPGTMELFAPLH